MKKRLIALFLFFAAAAAKADGVDFWRAFYNEIEIGSFSESLPGKVSIKAAGIHPGDSLTVRYFRDTPCARCTDYLIAEDDKHHVIATGQGGGTFTPVSVSLDDLLAFTKQSGQKDIELFYYEDSGRKEDKILLCTLHID